MSCERPAGGRRPDSSFTAHGHNPANGARDPADRRRDDDRHVGRSEERDRPAGDRGRVPSVSDSCRSPIEPLAHSALAIGMFMIACWMTQVLDHGVAGILGCFLFWMFGIAKFETAFSGFADTSPGSCSARSASD